MKKRLTALIVSILCFLSGCSSMLEQEYESVTPSAQIDTDAGDDAILQAETYQDLVTDITYFVSEGAETGTIRLYSYSGDVQEDLSAACLEVIQNTAMGAYAVDYITPTYSRIVSYYEAIITIQYRRTAEQIASMVTVSGITAIRSELKSLLQTFPTDIAFNVTYLNQDASSIEDLVAQAYYDNPAAALGLPTYSVSLYPSTGAGRHIVEISLTWPEDPAILQEKYAQVNAVAAALVESAVKDGQSNSQLAQALHAALSSTASYDAAGGETAYDALVLYKAGSRGLSLAFESLCDLAGLTCTPVEGYLYNVPFYWCIVASDEGYRHVDVTQKEFALKTDSQMTAAGFAWNQKNYPICGSG
ncbi:MAG: hypothetical protein H6Q60_1037 [Oscillospiraceae bacterium]|nr:hypothetical protein [Oscillospiraceae bacterium]